MRFTHPLLILILGWIGVYALVPLVSIDIYRLLGLEFAARGIPGLVRVEPDMMALYLRSTIVILCCAAIWFVLRRKKISRPWLLLIALLLFGEATFICDRIAQARRRAAEYPVAMRLEDSLRLVGGRKVKGALERHTNHSINAAISMRSLCMEYRIR